MNYSRSCLILKFLKSKVTLNSTIIIGSTATSSSSGGLFGNSSTNTFGNTANTGIKTNFFPTTYRNYAASHRFNDLLASRI